MLPRSRAGTRDNATRERLDTGGSDLRAVRNRTASDARAARDRTGSDARPGVERNVSGGLGSSVSGPRRERAGTNLTEASAGFLNEGTFQEAMRVIDVMRSAGGDAQQAQAERVEEMVLGMVDEQHAYLHSDEAAQAEEPVGHFDSMGAEDAAAQGRFPPVDADLVPVPEGDDENRASTVVPPQRVPRFHTTSDLSAPSGDLDSARSRFSSGMAPAEQEDAATTEPSAPVPRRTTRVMMRGSTRHSLYKASKTPVAAVAEVFDVQVDYQLKLLLLAKLIFVEFLKLRLLVPHALAISSNYIDDQRLHSAEWWEVGLPGLYALVAARIVVMIVYGFLDLISPFLYLPSTVKLTLAAFADWPIICLLGIIFFYGFELMDPFIWKFFPNNNAEEIWMTLTRVGESTKVFTWLAICAVTRAFLELGLMIMVNGLTLRHYERRAKNAMSAYNAIRALFAVAQAAEQAKKKAASTQWQNRKAAVQQAAEEAMQKVEEARQEDEREQEAFQTAMTSSKRLGRLEFALQVISGPLQFGSGFRDAKTLDEARTRARKVYHLLLKAQHLLRGNDTDTWALSREQVFDWVDDDAADVFPMDPVKEEDFVAVVERAFKEQKFISASFSAFDVLNGVVIRTFVALWTVAMALILVLITGVDFVTYVLPVLTLVAYIAWVSSSIVGPIIQGALFVLWTRPFDVGDWIKIADPGQNPPADALVVVRIGLLNSVFAVVTGMQVLVPNKALHFKTIHNLSRSKTTAFSMQLQVPAKTMPSKLTELVDAIKVYVTKVPEDWSDASLSFGMIDQKKNILLLDLWMSCNVAHQDFVGLATAKSRLYLFVHAYMQAAGIDYAKPVQPYKQVRGEAGFPMLGALM